MTRITTLLVEGPTDQMAFQSLKNALVDIGYHDAKSVAIHTAQSLLSDEIGIGNREKIERVFSGLDEGALQAKVAGFVDREFREFDTDAWLDRLGDLHHVAGRVVWSRGHSIENYLFDLQTLVMAIRSAALTPSFAAAMERFERVYEPLLRLACAISLSGQEYNRLRMLPATLDRASIIVDDDMVGLVEDRWFDKLVEASKGDRVTARALIDSARAWQARLVDCPSNTIRWLCHGHIGFRVIWQGYSRCVELTAGDEAEPDRVFRASEEVLVNACAFHWAQQIAADQVVWPKAVFSMLGLPG